jgi:hypothetical protein
MLETGAVEAAAAAGKPVACPKSAAHDYTRRRRHCWDLISTPQRVGLDRKNHALV